MSVDVWLCTNTLSPLPVHVDCIACSWAGQAGRNCMSFAASIIRKISLPSPPPLSKFGQEVKTGPFLYQFSSLWFVLHKMFCISLRNAMELSRDNWNRFALHPYILPSIPPSKGSQKFFCMISEFWTLWLAQLNMQLRHTLPAMVTCAQHRQNMVRQARVSCRIGRWVRLHGSPGLAVG